MKSKIIILALLTTCSYMMAQTEFDALKYVQTDINGTARYMSMAGAFGALGGDPSAIKDNPAGLGIYRRSEITGTLNTIIQGSTSNWQYQENGLNKNSYGYDNLYKVGPNNISLVIASPTWRNESENDKDGLVSSNWSFSYNRIKNFDRNINIKSGASLSSISDYLSYFSEGLYPVDFYYSSGNIGTVLNNPYIPTLSTYGYQGFLMDSVAPGKWRSSVSNLTTPSYRLTEKGHLDEYAVGWAGNFGNKIYIGATLSYRDLNYSAMSKYSENYETGGNINIGDTIYTKGSGVKLNIGAIVKPTDFLRIGLSLQTPTLYSITDNYYSTLVYNRIMSGNNKFYGTIVAPEASNSYQLQDPVQINASAAYIIGKKGLISVEYDYINYTGSKFLSIDNHDYSGVNEGMNQTLNDVSTIKIGGEYKLTDNFSLRAGYANTNNGTKSDAEKLLDIYTKRVDTQYFLQNNTNYFTLGFGYREANWFIDFAYMNKVVNETFYAYNTNNLVKELVSNATTPDQKDYARSLAINPASVITSINNAVITLGFKF